MLKGGFWSPLQNIIILGYAGVQASLALAGEACTPVVSCFHT